MIQQQPVQGYTLLSGAAGIGKTWLIKEYLRGFDCSNTITSWINAANEMTLLNGIYDLIDNNRRRQQSSADNHISKLLEQMSHYQNGFLVFDNVKSVDIVLNIFPIDDQRRSNIKVIIILQQDILPDRTVDNVLRLEAFTHADAHQFVSNRLDIDTSIDQHVEYVHNLITALHCHPMALQQAALAILACRSNSSAAQSIPGYLTEFGKLQSVNADDDVYNKIPLMTSQLALQFLRTNEDSDGCNFLQSILETIAYFRLAPFQMELLQMQSMNHLHHNAILKLLQYGLLFVHSEPNSIQMPELVRNMIIAQIPDESKALRDCLKMLNKCADINVINKSILNFVSIWQQAAEYRELVKQFHELPNKILCILIKSGRIALADLFGTFAGLVLDSILGADNLSAVKVLSKRAEVAFIQKKYAEAQFGYERVVSERTRQLSVDHPSTVKAQYSLAAVLYKSGQFSAVQRIYESELERITRLNKGNDDHSANRDRLLDNIRKIQLLQMKKAAAAISDIREQPSAVSPHDTLDVVIECQRKGRYQEGIELCKAIIVRSKNNISEQLEHLRATRRLAKLYQLQGNYADALAMNRELLAIGQIALGPKHEDNLIAKRRIANIQQVQGHFDIASKSYTDLLAESLALLGPDHPDHLQIRREQAYLWRNMGQLNESLQAYSEILNDGELALGHDHPTNLITKRCIASVWQQMGNFEMAAMIYEEVLQSGTEILGRGHCDHLIAKRGLAATFLQQGRTEEALKLFVSVLVKGIETFGKSHPDNELTRQAILDAMQLVMNDTASSEYTVEVDATKQRDVVDAIETSPEPNEEVLVAPSQHLITKCCIAAVLQDQGEYDAAFSAYQDVLDRREKELGPDHPDNLITRRAMAAVLQKQGKYDEAIRAYREILDCGEKLLGPDHEDNSTLRRHIASVQRQKMKFKNFLVDFHAERVRANKFNTGFLLMLLTLVISLLVIYSQP